ncbi:hypothetical protein MRX96_017755 [Rhipicephalus microplus]
MRTSESAKQATSLAKQIAGRDCRLRRRGTMPDTYDLRRPTDRPRDPQILPDIEMPIRHSAFLLVSCVSSPPPLAFPLASLGVLVVFIVIAQGEHGRQIYIKFRSLRPGL